MRDYKEAIAKALNEAEIGLSYDEILANVEIPPDAEMGDYAFPCFKLAKVMRMAPPRIAGELVEKLKLPDCISEAKPLGPYLNFFVDRATFARDVLSEVLAKGDRYGSNELGKGKNAVVEFSSTNIAKPFHIGHIRSTVIGNALNNIYRFSGYNTTAINYIGDYGTQFGMMIAAYRMWGDEDKIAADPINELLKLYVSYNQLAEEDLEKMEEARHWFHELEIENPEAVRLWQWFKEISLGEFNRVYEMLGIRFDSYNGEAFSAQFNEEVIGELKEKNLLEESDGAMIINLEDVGLPNMIVIKRDGSSTYIARDIATAKYRKAEYDFDRNIYVVGSEQILHFKQLKACLAKMGYDWGKDCIHVPFGMISLKDVTLSTRKGQVLFLEDVLNTAVEKTRAIIEARNPNLENKDTVARQVGIGAVMFQELFSNRIKDYVFDWDETLNFDGETGPYVQYTQARAGSILSKAGVEVDADFDATKITSDEEFELLHALYSLPDRVVDAMEKYEPSYVTRQLVEIAKCFNKFYNSCHILNAEEATKTARLALVAATRTAIVNGLALLGIRSPEKM